MSTKPPYPMTLAGLARLNVSTNACAISILSRQMMFPANHELTTGPVLVRDAAELYQATERLVEAAGINAVMAGAKPLHVQAQAMGCLDAYRGGGLEAMSQDFIDKVIYGEAVEGQGPEDYPIELNRDCVKTARGLDYWLGSSPNEESDLAELFTSPAVQTIAEREALEDIRTTVDLAAQVWGEEHLGGIPTRDLRAAFSSFSEKFDTLDKIELFNGGRLHRSPMSAHGVVLINRAYEGRLISTESRTLVPTADESPRAALTLVRQAAALQLRAQKFLELSVAAEYLFGRQQSDIDVLVPIRSSLQHRGVSKITEAAERHRDEAVTFVLCAFGDLSEELQQKMKNAGVETLAYKHQQLADLDTWYLEVPEADLADDLVSQRLLEGETTSNRLADVRLRSSVVSEDIAKGSIPPYSTAEKTGQIALDLEVAKQSLITQLAEELKERPLDGPDVDGPDLDGPNLGGPRPGRGPRGPAGPAGLDF